MREAKIEKRLRGLKVTETKIDQIIETSTSKTEKRSVIWFTGCRSKIVFKKCYLKTNGLNIWIKKDSPNLQYEINFSPNFHININLFLYLFYIK